MAPPLRIPEPRDLRRPLMAPAGRARASTSVFGAGTGAENAGDETARTARERTMDLEYMMDVKKKSRV